MLADQISGRWTGRVRDAVLVVACAALVALAAQVRLPLAVTPVPITGQTFAVLLVGAGLGFGRGSAAIGLYVLAGVLGTPVFVDGGSGFRHLFGATGGYLIGFVAAAAVLGWLAERRFERRISTSLAAMFVATAVIYGCGVAGLVLVAGMSLPQAVTAGVLPFLAVDAIKAVLAAVLLPAAWAVAGHPDDVRLP